MSIWTSAHGEILRELVADRFPGKKLKTLYGEIDVRKRTIETWFAGNHEPDPAGRSGDALQKLAEGLGYSCWGSLREHIDYLFVGKNRIGTPSARGSSRDYDLKNAIFDESVRQSLMKPKFTTFPALATCVAGSRPVLPLEREKDPKPFPVFFQVSATVGLIDEGGAFSHALVYDRASYQRHDHTIGKAVAFGASYSWNIRQYVSDMDLWMALWKHDPERATAAFLTVRDGTPTLLRLLAYKIRFLHAHELVIRPLGITRNDQRELRLERSDGSVKQANRVYVAAAFSIGIRSADVEGAVARYVDPHSSDRFDMRFEERRTDPKTLFVNPDGGHNLIDVFLWNSMHGLSAFQHEKNERGDATFVPGDCLRGRAVAESGALQRHSPSRRARRP